MWAPPNGQNPTDFWPSRRPRSPPAAPAAVPAANLGPGTRPEPAPTTPGGYGRNTTGGWLADDPRVVPPRPCACGGSGAGFGVQEAGGNSSGGAMPIIRARRKTQFERERGFVQPPSGSFKSRRKESPSSFKIVASLINICWLLHMRHRPLWV
jgi:hypothetical protein